MPTPAVRALLVALCLGLGSLGCGEDDVAAPPAAATPDAAEAGCRSVPAPAGRPSPDLPRPRTRLDPARTYVASVVTSCGTFAITLDAERAPRTGGAFLSLARAGFFDGLTFHRILASFVIQAGDPEGTGNGGPGFSVREPPPRDLVYAPGVVAMAKTATEPAGTSGSQFFVVTGPGGRQLTPDYALLGQVTAGMDVVARIAAVPADPESGTPREPVGITSVTVDAT